MKDIIIKVFCEKIENLEIELEMLRFSKNEEINALLDEIFKLKEELEDYRKTKEEISQVIRRN